MSALAYQPITRNLQANWANVVYLKGTTRVFSSLQMFI